MLESAEGYSSGGEGAGFLILNSEARKQIGEAAREKIEADLTWDAEAKKYLEMIDEAILVRAGAAPA